MNKAPLPLLLFLLLFSQLLAQPTSELEICVTMKPGAELGKDAVVWSNGPTNNYATVESNTAYSWTNRGVPGVKRFFLAFDLSPIPSTASITVAKLSFFYNPTDPSEGFDYHTGTNDIIIERVNSAWSESTLTWGNQPSTTSANQVSVGPSISQSQDYLNINVTDLVADMNHPSNVNHGFMVRMNDEVNYYRSVLFASSDHADSSLHPQLEVCYRTDWPLAIELDEPQKLEILVYPNPNNGRFQIQVPGDNIQDYAIEVFDLLGKRIQTPEWMNGYLTIYEQGVYMVRIMDSEGNYAIEKVIVN